LTQSLSGVLAIHPPLFNLERPQMATMKYSNSCYYTVSTKTL